MYVYHFEKRCLVKYFSMDSTHASKNLNMEKNRCTLFKSERLDEFSKRVTTVTLDRGARLHAYIAQARKRILTKEIQSMFMIVIRVRSLRP